jgi:CRP-like cAMP-binding protein
VTGREGAIGMAAVLGGDSTPFWSEVVSPGFAYRLDASLLARELQQYTPLARELFRYLHKLIGETGRNAACNRHHSLEQRLSRWLLTRSDQLRSKELAVTQQIIASMLGVRRESITGAIGKLASTGLIQNSRGRINILDIDGLAALACECYAPPLSEQPVQAQSRNVLETPKYAPQARLLRTAR